MRLTILVLGMFFALNVSAAVTIGDKIHRVGTFTYAGIQGAIADDQEVIAANAATHQYLIRTVSKTSLGNGQPTTKDEWKDDAQIMSRQQTAALLANCSTFGGHKETVTVGASVFSETCAVPQNASGCNGTVWFADVPFGVLKIDVACPSQNIQKLEMPTSSERGGEFSYQWGS